MIELARLVWAKSTRHERITICLMPVILGAWIVWEVVFYHER